MIFTQLSSKFPIFFYLNDRFLVTVTHFKPNLKPSLSLSLSLSPSLKTLLLSKQKNTISTTLFTPLRLTSPSLGSLISKNTVSTSTCIHFYASKKKKPSFSTSSSSSSSSSSFTSQLDSLQQDQDINPLLFLKPKLHQVIQQLTLKLNQFNTGKVNPNWLNNLIVSIGSQKLNLSSLAQVTLKDATTLYVMVSKEEYVKPIISAIQKSPFHFNPLLENQTTLKVPVPKPSQETRQALAKQLSLTSEKAKIELRQLRQLGMQTLKSSSMISDERRKLEKELQKWIDDHCSQIDELEKTKLKEVKGGGSA